MSGYFRLMTHLLTLFLIHPFISKAKITFICNNQVIHGLFCQALERC